MLLSLGLFCIKKNYYHCNYLFITDRNFSSVVPNGWSAVGLVPEWELIIRFDEEMRVPVMSEQARLQMTSALFNNSIANTPSAHIRAHVTALFPPCCRAVVKSSTKRCWEWSFSACWQVLRCDSFPYATGHRGAVRKSNACPQSFNARIVCPRFPTAVGLEKGSIVAYE